MEHFYRYSRSCNTPFNCDLAARMELLRSSNGVNVSTDKNTLVDGLSRRKSDTKARVDAIIDVVSNRRTTNAIIINTIIARPSIG